MPGSGAARSLKGLHLLLRNEGTAMPGGEAAAWCWCRGVLIPSLKGNLALGGEAANKSISLGPVRAIPAAALCPGASRALQVLSLVWGELCGDPAVEIT